MLEPTHPDTLPPDSAAEGGAPPDGVKAGRGLAILPDRELAVLAGKGSRDAWAALYQRHEEGLRAIARSLTAAEDAAADLVQDAMVRAWEYRASYDDAYAYKTWVTTILRRLYYSQHRRDKTYRGVVQENIVEKGVGLWHGQDVPSADEALLHQENLVRLERALDTLEAEDRAVLAAWADGQESKELARNEGVSPSTYRGRVFRAKNRLTEAFFGSCG